MKKICKIGFIVFVIAFMFTACAANFAGTTPTESTDVRFITGNEVISKNDYDVKGVVVVQRSKSYFDFFGLIKPTNKALSEVFTEDIANELIQKVIEIGGNAVMDMQIVDFEAIPGGTIYLIPIGTAQVTIQATAIKIK